MTETTHEANTAEGKKYTEDIKETIRTQPHLLHGHKKLKKDNATQVNP